MLSDLKKSMFILDKNRVNLSRDIKTIIKKTNGNSVKISEIEKNPLDGINSRVEIAEERISELRDKSKNIIPIHIIVKLPRSNNKEKILKAARIK